MNEAVIVANTVASGIMMFAWQSKDWPNRIIKIAWFMLFVQNLLAFR